jgi:hypothetical protein
MSDQRYAFGEACTWNGPIACATATDRGCYVCPRCGGALWTFPNELEWNRQAAAFCSANNLELDVYIEWMTVLSKCGRCEPLDGWDWKASYCAFKEQFFRV